MTSIRDLAPYSYGSPLFPGELAVGWLDGGDIVPTGRLPKLLRRLLVDRLTFAAAYLPSGTDDWMGVHSCAFCDGPTSALPNHALWGSGELRVTGADGTAYVAPSLVAHYIDRHAYLPPAVFIEAVAAGRFVEQPHPELDRYVVDRVEAAPDDLAAELGITAVVRGHVVPWNRTPGPPVLGFAVGRAWYGPWDGTSGRAGTLLATATPLGRLPP